MKTLLLAILTIGFITAAIPAFAQQSGGSCAEICLKRCANTTSSSQKSLCLSRCTSRCEENRSGTKK